MPYTGQLDCLRRLLLSSTTVPNYYEDLEIDTVDAFQGREKDIVIISTVRSNAFGNLGFLGDTRRLNVAITRAKRAMFILGNVATL